MKKTILYICLLIVITSAGCSSQSKMMQTDLYFGLSKNDGTIISDSAWNVFVKNNVSAVFTEGFTVISADGGWFSEEDKRFYSEPSRIVVHLGRMNPLLSKKTDSLRQLYKNLYEQESVLRVNKKITLKK